jgi:hypothetical protein
MDQRDSMHYARVKRGLDNWNTRQNADAVERQANPTDEDEEKEPQ